MARFLKKRNNTKGLVPGSPVFIGSKKVFNLLLKIDSNSLHIN